MLSLLATTTCVLAVWAICSLAEAAIYAVRMPYVRQLAQDHQRAGAILLRFKQNMERPISAILIVNTIVAAAGASLVGAQANSLLGERNLWKFTLTFTVAALFISEILPKILGVVYCRRVSRSIAQPLAAIVTLLYPVVWLVERGSRMFKPTSPAATAPENEVQQLAEISAEEGSIMPYEADLVRNVLHLDQVTAEEIMTPTSVVVKVPDSLSIGELTSPVADWNFSRIPIYRDSDPSHWTGMLLSRDVLKALAEDRFHESVQTLAHPLHFVASDAPAHQLLKSFLKRRTHLFAVLDAASHEVVGVVTLEDVLESMIGAEIVDELDTIFDMRSLSS